MTPPILSHRGRPHLGRRILLISPYPPSRTGPAEYAAVFAAQCAARGFQIRVLTENVPDAPPTPPVGPGVTIDPVWTPNGSGLGHLYRAAKDDPAEVVHVNYSFTMYGGGLVGLFALAQFARLSRRHPLVVTLFDVLPKRELTAETLALYHVRATPRIARMTVGLVLKFLARTADRIVVQGQSTKTILEQDYGVPSEKIVITELPGLSEHVEDPDRPSESAGPRDTPDDPLLRLPRPVQGNRGPARGVRPHAGGEPIVHRAARRGRDRPSTAPFRLRGPAAREGPPTRARAGGRVVPRLHRRSRCQRTLRRELSRRPPLPPDHRGERDPRHGDGARPTGGRDRPSPAHRTVERVPEQPGRPSRGTSRPSRNRSPRPPRAGSSRALRPP